MKLCIRARLRAACAAAVLLAAGLGLATPVRAAVEVFVNSSGTGDIKKYSDGTLVGSIASVGSSALDRARGVEFGPNGLLYVDALSGSVIRSYNPTTLIETGTPVTVGNPHNFSSPGPYGLSFGPDGNIYVAITSNDSIQRLSPTNSFTPVELVPQQSGGMRVPLDTLVLGNTLFVTGFGLGNGTSGQVYRYNATTGAFIDTFIAAGQNGLSGPVGLAAGLDGNLYVSGEQSSNVLKYDPNAATGGGFLGTFIASGTGGLLNPWDLTFNPDNGNLYVSDLNNSSVLEFNGTTGAFMSVAVAAGAGGLDTPTFLAVRGTDVTTGSSVPLPPAVWAGLVTMALLGVAIKLSTARRTA